MQVSWRGASFVGALVLTAIAGLFMLLTPAILVLYIFGRRGEALFHFVQQMVQGMWLGNVAILVEQWHGMSTEIYIIGDKSRISCITSAERAVWISNHRTRIDWMLLWSLGLRTNTLHQLKIVLKDSLRAVPVFGWAMQAFQFIFLSRDWKTDEKALTRLLTHLGRARPNSTYLLFPEGTDLAPSSVIKSNQFAATRGLPPRHYTLTAWFPLFVCWDDNDMTYPCSYDLTLCYVDHKDTKDQRPSEASLLSGHMPSAIKILLERIPIESIPLDAASLRQWMDDRFAAKEAMLDQWYTLQTLPPAAERILDHDILRRAHLVQAYWILLCTLCFMMLYQYPLVRWCGVSKQNELPPT
ncbi:hypothetical protein DYB34_010083 [Aphanomyces astaci]|uniref:Phospholipid/glycerol acyltransferase domain-containing protein n=2 Tax=Aphanomyces astaci TaxID=112090 RepID=A0A418BN87_APHAT|nr:hypothetical protein DYB34_010083 [Aphanomyces astaci]